MLPRIFSETLPCDIEVFMSQLDCSDIQAQKERRNKIGRDKVSIAN